MKFTHQEVGFLMRCMLRSLEGTPKKDQPQHHQLYDRFAAEFVRTMDPKDRAAVDKAMDDMTGEYRR